MRSITDFTTPIDKAISLLNPHAYLLKIEIRVGRTQSGNCKNNGVRYGANASGLLSCGCRVRAKPNNGDFKTAKTIDVTFIQCTMHSLEK